MEHPNHKITEASLTFNVKLDEDQFIDRLPVLKKELADHGFRFIRRFPSQLNLSLHPQGIIIQQQEGHFQLLFQNQTKSYILNIGTNQIGCHVVNTYAGWETFKNDLWFPIFKLMQSLVPDTQIIGGAFNYINVFSLSEVELSAQWFRFIHSDYPLLEAVVNEVWRDEKNMYYRLDVVTSPVADSERFVRVAPVVGINFEPQSLFPLSDDDRVINFANLLHESTRNVFFRSVKEPLIQYISKKGE